MNIGYLEGGEVSLIIIVMYLPVRRCRSEYHAGVQPRPPNHRYTTINASQSTH